MLQTRGGVPAVPARALLSVAAVCIFACLVLLWFIEPRQVAHLVGRLDLVSLSYVLSLSIGAFGLRFVRWNWLMRRLGYRVPPVRHLLCYVGAFAFSVTPGQGGELVRGAFLNRHGVRWPDTVAVFVCEKALDLLAVAMLATLSFRHALGSEWYGILAILGVGLIAVAVQKTNLLKWAVRPVEAWIRGKSTNGSSYFGAIAIAGSSLLLPIPLTGGLLIGGVAWSLQGIALWVLANDLQLELGLLTAVGIFGASTLAGAFSFIPGGLGATEGAMATLLVFSGIDVVEAVALSLLFRVATFWFAVTLGVLALTVLGAASRSSS